MGVQFPGPPVVPVYPDPMQEHQKQRRPDLSSRLNLQPGLKVLVIGRDPLAFVQEVVERAGAEGEVAFVTDRQTMAAQIKAELSGAAAGRMAVYLASPDGLPFADNSLHRAIAGGIRRGPDGGRRELQELARVIKPGGLLGIDRRLIDRGSAGSRTVRRWCKEAGFEPVRRYGGPLHCLSVFWEKPDVDDE